MCALQEYKAAEKRQRAEKRNAEAATEAKRKKLVSECERAEMGEPDGQGKPRTAVKQEKHENEEKPGGDSESS